MPNLEKYKAVQIFNMEENRNQEDHKFFGNFILWIEIIVKFETKNLVRPHYQCLKYIITVQFETFFLTLALKTGDTFVMALATP